jgi:hypothetical protein
VSDIETNKNDSISNGNINIGRYSGAKVLLKKISDIGSIADTFDKTNLIFNILANEKLVYRDHFYFDTNSAELYFEDPTTHMWYPYITDKATLKAVFDKDSYYLLRIDYFLNDNPNNFTDSDIKDISKFIGNDGQTQNNTGNIPFFNYSDTFNTLPSTLECTDVVFVKDSTDVDTTAFKKTISEDFVIDRDDLSYEIVKNELTKENPGSIPSIPQSNGYKSDLHGEIRDKIYYNEI